MLNGYENCKIKFHPIIFVAMIRNIILIFTIIIAGLSSCNSPKALYKKGVKMENAGLNKEAADYFYKSLLKNPAFEESRQGLYRTGNQVLNNELSAFFQQSQMGQKKEAINTYLRAKSFKDKLATVSVELSISPQYMVDFENLKTAYLTEQYEIGLGYLDSENYAAAEAIFKEIGRLEPNYKDSKKLEKIAYTEPFYKKGKTALSNQNFRTAYYAFDEVILTDPDYKDAQDLRNEALDKGLVTLGLIGFENGTNKTNANKKAEAFILNALSNSNDPFLKVIDRTNYNQLIEEQRLNLSGVVDESTAAEAGKLLGVKFLLGGTLVQVSQETGRLNKFTKKGFKAVKIKKHNTETDEDYYVNEYRKTTYYEYKQQNRAYVSIQIKVISLTTGEVLVSKILSKESIDEVHYYKYNGEGKYLFPSADGIVDKGYNNKKRLDNLLKSRQSIHSVDVLTDKSFRALANSIKSEVENFSYQYVK